MKEYGKLEVNQMVYALIEVLDAKAKLKFFDCNNNLIYDGYVYQLYDENEYKNYIIDYIKFDSISKSVICVIKNKSN